MTEQNTASVLDNKDDIARFQRSTIEQGLKLECMGMTHSTNAVARAAKQMLLNATPPVAPASAKKKLFAQFQTYRESLGDYEKGAKKLILPERYR